MTDLESKHRDLELAVALQGQRMEQFEKVILQLADTNVKIEQSLQRMIGLEIRHGETRENIDSLAELVRMHDIRLSDMERRKEFWTMSSQALWAGLLLIAIAACTLVWQQSNRQSAALTDYRENLLRNSRDAK